jgi:hypothetical protein
LLFVGNVLVVLSISVSLNKRRGEERKVYWVLVGKPEGKRPLGRPKRRWDQNGTWGD